MSKQSLKRIYDSKYLKFYDINFAEDAHYYMASRREPEHLALNQSKEDLETYLPDGVSLITVLRIKGEEPKLLLNKEYRYPAGKYLLSVPAGLIDEEDKAYDDARERTAIRELKEETGIEYTDGDMVKVINPLLFSTPGMTDESNALVYVEINRDEMPVLTQKGAEGGEQFDGSVLVTKEQAQKLMTEGKDADGIYYPVWTWAALLFFLGV